jgi:hypothetical protein
MTCTDSAVKPKFTALECIYITSCITDRICLHMSTLCSLSYDLKLDLRRNDRNDERIEIESRSKTPLSAEFTK